MNYRKARVIVSSLGVAGATLFGTACGSPSSTQPTSQSSSEALTAIQNCETQAGACFDGGNDQACDDQLRSCLGRSLPDAGGHPEAVGQRGGNGAGEGDDDASADGDAESRDDDSRGDGAPNEGHPSSGAAPGKAEGHDDGGPPAQVCVAALHACLATQTRPMDCADAARACLKGDHDAGGR